MSNSQPRTGYELAAKILESHPSDAIETLLKYGNGAECDWLEFKAGMTLLPEDENKGDRPDDLYWDYLLSIVAMANTRGGAFVIGVDDRKHVAVPLDSCDPRHVIEKEGKEAYLRKEVIARFDRPERKWTTKDHVAWSLPESIVPFLDKRIIPYNGTDVIVLLVTPRKIGEELFVVSKSSLGVFRHMPVRDMGELGHVKRLTMDGEFDNHRESREKHLSSSQLGIWWDELDAEQHTTHSDESLDNAIRAYHKKLEEDTRKKLRAFIPLDAEGGECDEPNDVEFENPEVIPVFEDEDEDCVDSKQQDESDTDEEQTFKGQNEEESKDVGHETEYDDGNDAEPEEEGRVVKISLIELLEQRERVVLVGEPGAGKTTCLAHFAVQQGKRDLPQPHLFAFIALGRWFAGGSVRGLVEKTCGISQAQIDKLIEEKRLHLVLDALNECPDHLRPAALEDIRLLLREHPEMPVVLSSRQSEGIRLSGFPIFEVQAMDEEHQRLFLERYLHNAAASSKILDSLMKQPGGGSIAQNPMLLRMVVDVVHAKGELPVGRATLYRRWLANWYDREEQKAKKAKDSLPWSKEESIHLLSQMAFAGRAEGYRDIPVLLARQSLDDSTGIFLDRLCQGPLLEIEDDFVHFRHETIQEYLCAEWLLEQPAAFDSIQKKDYNSWGMPIAYAAELRMPGKLPAELSEAVWEMNPWIAALVAASLPAKTGNGNRPDMILAEAIFSKSNLLLDKFHNSFRNEITDGGLFNTGNAPLSYMLHISENSKSVWTTFECAYLLNMPSFSSTMFLGKQYTPVTKLQYYRRLQAKTVNMLILSQNEAFLQVLAVFPEIQRANVVQGWLWFLQDISIESRITLVRKLKGVFNPLPIDILPLLLGEEITSVGKKRKGTNERIKEFPVLFGADYIQKSLESISNYPNLWAQAGIVQFLLFAKKRNFNICKAVRSIVVETIRILEEAAISPTSHWLNNRLKCLCGMLDESDVPLLLPSLSLFGRAILKRVAFNPKGLCNQFYAELPTAGSFQFCESDLNDSDKRRKIVTILLNEEFSMFSTEVKRENSAVWFKNINFPKGIRFVWNKADKNLNTPGTHLLVSFSVILRSGHYSFIPENIRLYKPAPSLSLIYTKKRFATGTKDLARPLKPPQSAQLSPQEITLNTNSLQMNRLSSCMPVTEKEQTATSWAVASQNHGNSIVLTSLEQIPRFESQLRPFLQARGIILEHEGGFNAWIRNWLCSDTGFFWCAVIKHPEIGGVYLVHPRERSDANGVFTTKFRIGDCRAEITTNKRMPDSFYVRVLEADRGKARTEPCEEPEKESDYSNKTRVFHTANGITGQVETFAETEALQLVNVWPNECMAIDDLTQLPERISVRKDCFPLNPVLLDSGTDRKSTGYGLHCECNNCNDEKESECEKCCGSGQLTCNHCGGSGILDCRRCGGTGTITLPPRDVTCKKCGGSGKYYRNGNYIGSCDRCGGSGTIHFDAHDVECNACGGTGLWNCRSCNGSGSIACFSCKGEGKFECWVCGGTGSLRVQVDFKTGKFFRKYKDETTWLSTNEVYLQREVDGDRIPLSGHWKNLLSATEKQMRDEKEAKARAARIAKDGHAIDICLEKVLRLSPTTIPTPERLERERLGCWLDDSGAPVFRGLVEGVAEKRADVGAFFNEQISKFPTQADAIRQGLSDTPVLLLKGPPGTGKTTVIVELIRQAIRQGKRVLLTSQTHQAVDNVLERLHKFRESGEDRKARMAVYAANESKLSDLGRRYMAGGQEEELKEIRQRAEENHERLEAECKRNRTIRSILADGTETAKAIVSRLEKRDASLQKEEKSRDADLEGIAARHAAETARENQSFGAFKGGNTKRKNAIQGSIDACDRTIRKLESDRDWFDRQAKGRSEKTAFATNTGVGRFLRKATDRALRSIDSIAGTHLDPKNAREAWRKANESLNAIWAEKRSHEAELANNEKELYDRTAAHDELLQSIDEQNNAEQEERRVVADNVFKSIRQASDDDTKPLYDAQSDRVSQLLAVNADEAGKLRPESSPREWEADIPSLDNEFSDLDVRRKFALDWAGELANSEAIMNRFLNAQTNVFFATCVGMGSWKALSDGTYEMRDEAAGGSGRTIFDLAIVDEAGHATFAETVVPLCSAKKAILIGDDKQLPPMLGDDLDCRRRMDEMCDAGVKTSDGKSCWFEYSMFQYLWENEEVFKIPRLMLDTQFRMHPDIGDFISQTFYEGELKNGVTEEERRFAFGSFRNAVCLLSTSNQKNRFEEWIGTSCRNQLEAEYVQGVVEELLAAIDAGSAEGDLGGKPLSLAVITPYAAQEALLKRGLSKCYRETDRISFAEDDIASVDRFQGDERDVVIASFVRSPNTNNGKRFPKLTFVHDMKRMNVAFSRAKRMLILVGDMKVLETAPGNEGGRKAFARFHEHVDARGREILVWEREVR